MNYLVVKLKLNCLKYRHFLFIKCASDEALKRENDSGKNVENLLAAAATRNAKSTIK